MRDIYHDKEDGMSGWFLDEGYDTGSRRGSGRGVEERDVSRREER